MVVLVGQIFRQSFCLSRMFEQHLAKRRGSDRGLLNLNLDACAFRELYVIVENDDPIRHDSKDAHG
jgi:hypothetical protein